MREPFPSQHSSAEVVHGRIDGATGFAVVSHMAENGVIFSDGIEDDRLVFTSGMTATVTLAEKRGRLVG